MEGGGGGHENYYPVSRGVTSQALLLSGRRAGLFTLIGLYKKDGKGLSVDVCLT